MTRINSSNWSVNDQITAARLQDFNEDLDDLYARGSDRLRVVSAISGTALKIDIGAGIYRVGSTIGSYAGGTNVTVTNAATNYVEIDATGTIQINTTNWTAAPTTLGRLAIVVCSGGVITSITLWKSDLVGGDLGSISAKTLAAKTANYSILTADVAKLFTNKGATTAIQLTLPSGSTGGYYYFFGIYASQYVVIRPASGDTLSSGSTTTDANNPAFYSNTPKSAGGIDALDDDTWAFMSSVGTWTRMVLKGYYMGGTTGSVTAVIEDLNFSSEASAAIGATLDSARATLGGVSAMFKGYAAGGSTGSRVTTIDDMVWIAETSAAIAATLDTAKTLGSCGIQSTTKGYFLGGFTGSYVSVIEDLDFAAETSAAISATLSTARVGAVGISASAKGYGMGGDTGSASNVIDAFVFSGETCGSIAATLDTARRQGTGGQSSTKGYHFGGLAGPTTTIENLVFSGETSAAIGTALGTARYDIVGLTAPNKIYVLGGQTGPKNSIEAFTTSGETIATLAATLDTSKSDGAGVYMA